MVLTLAPYISPQFLDNNGVPAAGYQLFAYLSGTSTKSDTYSDSAGTPNANPIILDSSGRAVIYLDPHAYKFVLTGPDDTDPPTSPIWTQDVVGFVPSGTADVDREITAGEALSTNELIYLSAGDGGRTAGRWYKADADLQYGSETAQGLAFANSDLAIAETGTARVVGSVSGLSSLTAGATYYVSATAGEITSSLTGLAYQRRVGVADSATTLLLSPWLPAVSPHLDVSLATTGNVGAGEDVLYTYTLPAATLFKNEMAVRLIASGTTANNANAKTIKLHIDDGSTDTTLIAATPTVSEAGEWTLGAAFWRVSATTCRATATFNSGPGSGSAVTHSETANDISDFGVTWANTVELRVTGEATSDNDIVIGIADTILVR